MQEGRSQISSWKEPFTEPRIVREPVFFTSVSEVAADSWDASAKRSKVANLAAIETVLR